MKSIKFVQHSKSLWTDFNIVTGQHAVEARSHVGSHHPTLRNLLPVDNDVTLFNGHLIIVTRLVVVYCNILKRKEMF